MCDDGYKWNSKICYDKDMNIVDCSSDKKVSEKLGVCIENKCTCTNGVGAIGIECPVNDTKKCASCNSGFYKKYSDDLKLQDDDFFCDRCVNNGDEIIGDTCKNCNSHGCSSGRGECLNNECACEEKYDGSFCELCKGELEGADCDINKCSPNHSDFLNCNKNNKKATCSTIDFSSKCVCNCENGGTCNEETGECVCKALSSFEGSQCKIDQCNEKHSNFHNCVNGVCKVDSYNGSASCDCQGTNFYGVFCEKQADSEFIKKCLDNDFKISDNCNNLDNNGMINLCKNKGRNFKNLINNENYCILPIKKPELYIINSNQDNVILKLVLNRDSNNYYTPDIDELSIKNLNYEIKEVNKEGFKNNSIIEEFSSSIIGACFDGIGGICEDNIDVESCLNKDKNNDTYTTTGKRMVKIL